MCQGAGLDFAHVLGHAIAHELGHVTRFSRKQRFVTHLGRAEEARAGWQTGGAYELPADACVAGRLIVQQVQPGNGSKPFLPALFTTLEWPADEIVQF